jgi:hypothetical protein
MYSVLFYVVLSDKLLVNLIKSFSTNYLPHELIHELLAIPAMPLLLTIRSTAGLLPVANPGMGRIHFRQIRGQGHLQEGRREPIMHSLSDLRGNDAGISGERGKKNYRVVGSDNRW